ncbi:MAG: aryl-sulfate sulfotransferase [Bacteroidia bacterium]
MKKISVFTLILFWFAASAQQYPGKILYSLKNSTTSQLIDTSGNTVHTWSHTGSPSTCYSTYLMPGGELWRTVNHTGNSFTGGPISGEVQKYDYNGNLLWDYVYSTTQYCTHHDICPMPNGNVLMIAYESKSSAEVSAAGCTTFSGTMWPDKIVEVQPTGATTGTVVWEWHAWDHLVQNTSPTSANYQTSIVNHPELLNINYNAKKDWMHVNGVNYNPMLDQIAISSHYLNEIYVIDHSTTTAEAAGHTGGNSGKGGDILYRWGNPAAYGATGTQIFNVVHDAHWIKEGYGLPNENDLAGYNNQGISMSASCADFFTPPVNGYNYTITLGSAYSPSTYNKRQASGGYNSNEGSSQQLPNGDVLINMGISGYIKEYNSSGTLVWSKTLTGSTAKAYKYDDCYINNPAPATPTISEANGVLTASTADEYQWFMNGQKLAGETAQTYTPTQDGIYLVRTTDANHCVYVYSSGYHFTLSTGVKETSATDFSVYPNPSNGIVNISEEKLSGKHFEVKVYDSTGRLLVSNRTLYQLDLAEFGSGLYHIVILPENEIAKDFIVAVQ